MLKKKSQQTNPNSNKCFQMNHYGRDTDKFKRYYKWNYSVGWLTNNQCNLLHSLAFYTMFQLQILETVFRNLRVEEFKRIAVVMEIQSVLIFFFSVKCLLVVSLQIPKVYTAIERFIKLWMIFDYAYFLWYLGVFTGGTVQQRKTEYVMFHNVKTLHFTFYVCILHISQCKNVF